MLNFTKMHGLGNDFIVIDNMQGEHHFDAARIRALADRKFGIGFDQLLIVEAPSVANAEFDYRIYNCDGGEVEHCGNGARCFARFVHDKGMTDSSRIAVNTMGGVIHLQVKPDDQVTVQMGIPEFTPALIPFVAEERADTYALTVDDETFEVSTVAIGNPHVVLLVDDVINAPVKKLGAKIESHSRFPNRVNVGFLQIIDRTHANLRVYERGVGETRACGTGACAAMVVSQQKNLLDKTAVMTLPGGDLTISWAGENHNVEMTGPCTTVFEGQTKM